MYHVPVVPASNIKQIVNNVTPAHNQTFQYDNMNRLTQGQAGTLWGNTNQIDAFGNLYQFNAIAGVNPGQTMTLTPTANNQLSGGRVAYDAAGNMSSDMMGTPYLYDAENRIGQTGSTVYSYDGDGKRVMKLGGSSNWAYWYGANGEVLNEFNTTGGGNYVRNIYLGGELRARRYASTAIDYIAGDQIGSARVVVNSSGTVEDNNDYLPFGGTAPGGTTTSGDIYKFTGKERDTESGLDYFGARYYGSNMGRWMSPDWSKNPEAVPYASLKDPQSLNLYSYVGNNPLKQKDPDGHHQECAPDTSSTGKDGSLTVTAGACHEVPDWWQFQGVRRWVGNHPKTVKAGFGVVNAATVVSGLLDGGASELALPEELIAEEAILEAGEIAAEEAAEAGAEKAGEVASEKTAKYFAKRIEKELGKDARRDFHDEKMGGGGDRTLQQLKDDARAIFEDHGKTPPPWTK